MEDKDALTSDAGGEVQARTAEGDKITLETETLTVEDDPAPEAEEDPTGAERVDEDVPVEDPDGSTENDEDLDGEDPEPTPV
jgi:hypothetical protein